MPATVGCSPDPVISAAIPTFGGSTTRRRRPKESGQAGLLLLAGLAGSLLLAGALLPAPSPSSNHREHEIRKLEWLRRGLVSAMETHQVVPSSADWSALVEARLGWEPGAATRVYPEIPSETAARRWLWVDPALGAMGLPYTQSVAGLQGEFTHLAGPSGRLLLVSNTRRQLPIPMADRAPTQAEFDALWHWTFDPASPEPPDGWPETWQAHAAHLHVARISMADLFRTLRFEGVGYSLNGVGVSASELPVEGRFLQGGHLKVFTDDGTLWQSRTVRSDETFWNPRDPDPSFEYFLTGVGTVSDKDGIPCAYLSRKEPTAVNLPNYDPKRDAFPGLLLAKGGSGPNESDATKVQRWITAISPVTFRGEVTLTLYSAMKDFNRSKGGYLVLYLVKTNPAGNNPEVLASTRLRRSDWDKHNSGNWIEDRVSFGQLDLEIPFPHRLGVAIVVHPDADDDHWFAYGTAAYPAHIEVQSP